MKKSLFAISVLVILLSVAVAFAASSVSLPSSVTLTAAGRNVTASQTFTVTNTGNTTLSGITITSDADPKYKVQFSNVPSVLNVSASKTVTIKAYAPVDESLSTHTIGGIIFNSNAVTNRTDLKLNVQSQLKIDQVKISIGSNSKEMSSSGKEFDNTKSLIGDSYSVNVKVCNGFSDSSDKIKNIKIKAVFQGIDNGDDINGDVSEFTLSGGSCTSYKLVKMDQSTIPLKADEDTYDLQITVEGDDSNGNNYDDSWTIPVHIYRNNDPSMFFEKTDVLPSQITCERQITIDTSAYNTGDSDDNGVLTIKNSALGINIAKYFGFGSDPSTDCDAIDNPNDDCIGFDKSFSVELPNNIATGSYPVDFKLYYSTDNLMSEKIVNLDVQPCQTQATTTTPTTPATTTPATTTPATNPNVVVVTQPSNTVPATGAAATIVKKENTNNLYIAGLVTIDLAIIALIIYLLTLFII